jgi:hypothetical protein
VSAGGVASCPKDAVSGSRRSDSAPHRNITGDTAVIPAIPVRARGKRSLTVPVVDNKIVLVDALLPSASIERCGRGHKENKMYGARSFHKIY